MVDATIAYAEATSSSVHFLIVKNERMAKELQAAKTEGEHVTTFAKEELKKAILDELSSLEITTRMLYSKFGIMHKEIVHLKNWQQRCARRARILSNLHIAIDCMQTWTVRYKGAPLHFPKLMKPKAVELKARIMSQI